jgi:hypothetical protein
MFATAGGRPLKSVENRKRPLRQLGRIWIHAATNDKAFRREPGWEAWPVPEGVSDPRGKALQGEALVFGAIIGSVEVVGCVPLAELPDEYRDAPDPAFDPCGPWCWLLAGPEPLAEPVPCPGKLSLWTPPPDVLAALEEAEAA